MVSLCWSPYNILYGAAFFSDTVIFNNRTFISQKNKASVFFSPIKDAMVTSNGASLTQNPSVSVYPNPIKDHFRVQLSRKLQDKESRILLFDAMGRKVNSYDVKTTQFTITAPDLP